MTESQRVSPAPFTIRRIDRGQTAQTPAPEGTSASSGTDSARSLVPQDVARENPLGLCGGLFQSGDRLLAFLGTMLGSGLADQAVVRETPDHTWWIEVEAVTAQASSLIWTAGGQPFVLSNNRWTGLNAAGRLEAENILPNVATWRIVEFSYLLANTALRPSRYRGNDALVVMTPNALARVALRRATVLGLHVTLRPVSVQPLGQHDGATASMTMLHVQSERQRPIPMALAHGLADLPYTVVGEETTGQGGAIIVDVNHRLPLAPELFQEMVPDQEAWIFAPQDIGYLRAQYEGKTLDGALLLVGPQVPVISLPAVRSALPDLRIPVQLVAQRSVSNRADAVLLDDHEIAWLKRFLMGRPVGESSFILPGNSAHLLVSPGGVVDVLPFGVPLTWVGPGALYLELGTAFYPPLSDAARKRQFELTPDTVVALTQRGAYRFAISEMTPTWALWVGDAPEIETKLPREGERLLKSIPVAVRKAEAERFRPQRQLGRGERVQDPGTLLELAQRAELRGDLVEAAQLLERLGQHGRAGQLYERAARQRR